MKAFRIFSRNIRDAFNSVFRNFSLSLASISCITITLLVVSIFIILSYNVNNFTRLVEQDVTIVAFLDVDITDDEVKVIEEKIKRIDNVDTYSFESKQQIADEMMEGNETFKSIMENWSEDENPLKSTFRIKATSIEEVEGIAKKVEKIEGVSEVKWGQDMIHSLITVFDVVRKICAGTVIALILVTAFLIANTIKITIHSRKREIDIMRLVGASNINIKIPFIFEGLFLGVLGSIIPIIATIYGYTELYKNFDGQLFSPFIRLVSPQPFIFVISIILLVIGVLVGMFGSWRAVKKHLKI